MGFWGPMLGFDTFDKNDKNNFHLSFLVLSTVPAVLSTAIFYVIFY